VPELTVLTTSEAPPELLAELRPLLDVAFGGRFTDHDWEHALGGRHAVLGDGGAILAHAAVVPRLLVVGDRGLRAGYVEAVATAPDHHGRGFGSLVMGAVDGILRRHHELGALSTGSHGFYERLGWERWQGPTGVRHGDAVVPSPEEDDGVMVLRFGASAGIDLGAPISCGARPGDAW
jgi:aminoglycoside 2'-N-acetyltransferase I